MSFGDGHSRSDKAETGDEHLLTPPAGEGQARQGAGTARSIAARAAAEAVARRSYGKFVAFLAARTRDVAAAEDALSEAFAAALTDWPVRVSSEPGSVAADSGSQEDDRYAPR